MKENSEQNENLNIPVPDSAFNLETLSLANDYEGEAVATLISAKANSGKRKSVLYLHGYVDYFFHPHLAEKFLDNGFDFYALDMRKHGRSLLPHQRPNICKDLGEYFEEISIALRKIHAGGNVRVFLLGHSTGGLTAALYMNFGQEKKLVSGLILNSPFLDFNLNGFQKALSLSIARFMAAAFPFSKVTGTIPRAYGQSLHKNYNGEWDFNLNWKPVDGFPTYFAWIVATHKAHQKLKNSNIEVPVLVLHSSKSLKLSKFTEAAATADLILNVADIKRLAPKLGKNVILEEIKKAVHDVFLSKKKVRAKAYDAMFRWLENSDYF